MGRMYTPGYVHSTCTYTVVIEETSTSSRFDSNPLPLTLASCSILLHRSKGIARSSLPYRRTPPSWCRTESDTVKQEIIKFAKKGLTPSQIGVRLRDSMGIPQVVTVTGSKILRILKVAGMFSVPVRPLVVRAVHTLGCVLRARRACGVGASWT